MTTRMILVFFFFYMTATMSYGQAKKTGERPKAFPKVDQLAGSVPYYTSVRLDVDTNDVGYVMFDGNVSNGYERIYFWSPDDPDYRTPKMFRYNAETKRFGPIKFTPKNETDEVKLDWSFGWGRGGGAYEHHDYLTGQTVKGNNPIYPWFSFYCDYARQPRGGARGESLVDITMSGGLNATLWTNMPAPLQPWHTLNFFMGVKLVREKDASLARFDGRLNYGDSPCVVRSLPKESTCTLTISPYMGTPVYSNDVPWSDALLKGVIVKLDYGWYDMSWGMYCPGLNVVTRLDSGVRVNPFSISRFED